MRVGVGQAEAADSGEAMRRALAQASRALHGAAPGAALVFTHIDADHKALLETFAADYPTTPLVGCSTAGEYSSVGGFSEDSVIVILMQSDTVSFSSGLGRDASDDPERAVNEAMTQAREKLDGPARACLFFPDPRSATTDAALSALGSTLPSGCPVLGGTAACIGTSDVAPVQLFGNQVVNDAVPVLLLGGGVKCAFSVCNSWQPVGALTVVKKSHGNVVERIGDRPALEFYQHYLGPHIKPASEFPLAVHDPEADRFYLRVPIGYDPGTGSITFGAPVPDGAMVQLSEATPQRIIRETERSITEVAEQFDGVPALALAFSCNARKGILGTQVTRERELLATHLGADIATAGFYGFAEISPLIAGEANQRQHHATLVTVLIGDGVEDDGAGVDDKMSGLEVIESPDFLHRKLARSEYYRRDLEQIRDVNAALLRTVSREIEEARSDIARQKSELEVLHSELEKEQDKSEALLRNILPAKVAEELKKRGLVDPVFYPSVTVLFTDFVGFTTHAAALSPKQLVATLDSYFTAFDAIARRNGVEKLKTIGDAYMCVGGVPNANDTHVADMVHAALEMQELMAERARTESEEQWQLRIGIHTGPLMAGVIGTSKFAYDVWGNTVNIAARLESGGEEGQVNVSREVHDALADMFAFSHRGKISAKNIGEIDMYFVVPP
ncbi:MAG: FIST C-terminal domain-containing protein [Rhodospirillales bacterium]|nr:FIST C-terminal domain-containing protein [Rhodospirillales bacterium]